jgi:hypothetical protein
MIEDDPKTPEPAPQGAPAGDDKTSEKPTDQKPEGEAETQDIADEEEGDALAEEDEEEEGDDEEEQEGEEPKRKTSRAQRYRRQAERLKAENEALRSRSGGGPVPANEAALIQEIEARVRNEIGDPPRPEQFKDGKGEVDYIAFHNEQQAWLNDRRAVTREVKRGMMQAISEAQAHAAALVDAHKERVAKFKTKVKDFDQTMAAATMPVQPHVERLILASKKSERISYFLAKNQGKLAQLNRMDAESVARELGRLEGRLSLPPSKQQTKARKPVQPLRGGGASPTSQLAQVDAVMKKYYGDRR